MKISLRLCALFRLTEFVMDSNTSQPSPPACTDAEVMSFLSAPTPRRDIPPKIVSESYAQVAPGIDLFTAAMLVALGVFMLVITVLPSPIRHDDELSKKHAIARGIVRSAESVSYRTGGRGGGRQVNVFRFSFTFTPTNGGGAQFSETVTGVCYADRKLWEAATPVTVEYNPENVTIARIRGARIARGNASTPWLATVLFASVMGLLMLGLGIWLGRRFFKQRTLCRWLLENGTVDEFLVVDLNIIKRGRAPDIYTFQLKPANRNAGTRSYFSEFTKQNQINYAQAVRSAKTTTFGLYDPTGTDAKRLVLLVRSSFQ